jgi:DNA topoisomerase-1
MSQTQIKRIRQGNTFRYEGINGVINDKKSIERIVSLAIPPAWNEVKIARSDRSKIQASGKDAAGRWQYVYSQSYRDKQAAAKFDRITTFAEKLPELRKVLNRDLARNKFDKRKVLACAVTIMDETYLRVGNQRYAKHHHSYGLTTLRSKHLSIEGETVIFNFIGKSGQQQHKELNDLQIAKIVKRLDDMPGYELFRYYDNNGQIADLTSDDVNKYIKDIMGDNYSAKDFRTWGGTLLACVELAKIIRPQTKTARNKSISTCVKKVAKRLGNTPAIARSSYIDPRILDMFNNSDGIAEVYSTIENIKQSKYMSQNEQCVLKILTN